jgi:hypothetical protein
MKHIKVFEKFVYESEQETFADVFKTKNKWEKLSDKEKKILKDEIFDLISTAYAPIGGHVKVSKSDDIIDPDWDVWSAIDLDDDPHTDAVTFGKKIKHGIKFSGIGHDGSKEAKTAVFKTRSELLKKKGFFVEVSGKPAEIFVFKYNVPIIDKVEDIEKVVGKKVKFVGENPDVPNTYGWYSRSIGGGAEHLKLLLGLPPK